MNSNIRINQGTATKISLIIVIIITGIIYLRSGSFGFVNWDDEQNIRTDKHYTSLNISNIKYHYEHSRYKALAIWSLMIDTKMFINKKDKYQNPNNFHLHNVFLHLVNILLVFILIKRITKKNTIALISATLFALHPVFVEPVAWVTGRKDLLFVLFSMLAMLAYLKYLSKRYSILWLVAILIIVYIASLAKIQAFTLPLLMLGLDWYYKRKISIELILEKLMLVFLIADKWSIFFMLFFVCFFLYLFKTYKIDKKNNLSSFLYFYLLITTFFVIGFSTKIFNIKNGVTLIIFIISMLIYISGCVFAFKNKSKLITKLSEINHSKKILLLIIPLIIILSELVIKKIAGNFTWFHFWNIHPENMDYYSLSERIILAPNSLLFYISRFFLIYPQNPMVPYPEHTILGGLPSNLITTAIIVYFIFIIFLFLLIRYFRKNRFVILGLIWFLASISIVMHIIPIEGRVLAADRYAYPSFIGLFLVFGTAIDFLAEKINKIWILFGMIGIITILSIITYNDLGTWKSSKTLWQKTLLVNPENHYASYSLSMAFFAEENKPEEALKYLDKAIQLKEDYQYYNNRGRIRYALHDFNGALADINKSIMIDTNSFAAYNNRGILQQQLGNFKNARADFNKAINLKPNFTEAGNNLTKITRLIAIDSLIINNLYIPQVIHSEVIELINKTSQIYFNNREFDKAAIYLLKGINLEPGNQTFYEKLAALYQYNKDFEKSLKTYNSGLLYLPGNPTLLFGRGILYLQKGDTIMACTDIKLAASKGHAEAANFKKQICKD